MTDQHDPTTPPEGPAPTSPGPSADRAEAARTALHAVRAEVGKAVVGQDQAVSGLIVALLARGHILLEGVPGVAKTLLVRTLAAALSIDTKRVQFTPDLMPGDVTGSMVYDSGRGEFEFRPGPVFTNLLLADEINRTPPKTQSSLLEAMEERQVTVDGTSRPLPTPFLVAATQNPVEYEGTYPLPEAQLDRFLMKVTLPLPPREDETQVLERHAAGFDPRDLAAAGVRAVATPRTSRRVRPPSARCRSPPRSSGMSSTSPGRPARRPRCSSASALAVPPPSWARPGPGRGCPGATSSRRTTSRRWPGPPWCTGWRSARRPSSRA